MRRSFVGKLQAISCRTLTDKLVRAEVDKWQVDTRRGEVEPKASVAHLRLHKPAVHADIVTARVTLKLLA